MPPCGPIRLLIADDHVSFAASLKELLATETSVEVVGIVHDGAEAVELAASLRPDVVLLDLDMPRLDGFQAAERIRKQKPDTKIVIVTGTAGGSDRARDLGISGYVLKNDVREELVPAIQGQSAA
jgi:two-component system NarL family response regulator